MLAVKIQSSQKSLLQVDPMNWSTEYNTPGLRLRTQECVCRTIDVPGYHIYMSCVYLTLWIAVECVLHTRVHHSQNFGGRKNAPARERILKLGNYIYETHMHDFDLPDR